jgi:hypothetical protein
MRISRLPTLALCLGVGGLAAWAAYGSAAGVAAAAPLAGVTASQCEPLAVTSTAASPTPSPTAAASSQAPVDLCVSVSASADSFAAGQAATWTVQVWAQNGPVTGVTVTLTGTLAGQSPTFTSRCPGGDGSSVCTVGDMGTDITASSDAMQAQIPVPSGTAAGTSVTLTAAANASPSLPTAPAAATTVGVTAAPTPTSSPTPATTATPAAALPGIGTVPAVGSTVTSQTGVTAITSPGSVASLLPVITPAASATSPTSGLVGSPAADNPASPGGTADQTNAGNFVLIVPIATAEKIVGVILLILAVLAFRQRTRGTLVPRVVAGRGSRGTKRGSVASRRLKSSATAQPGQHGDSPNDTLDDQDP